MLNFANRFGVKVIGIASSKDSVLLKASDIKLLLPKVKETLETWKKDYYKSKSELLDLNQSADIKKAPGY